MEKSAFLHIRNVIFKWLFYKKPNVMTKKNTIKMILKGYSVCRFGDGELSCIVNHLNVGTFQKYDINLEEDLLLSLNNRDENMLVCLSDAMSQLYRYKLNVIYYYLSFVSLNYLKIQKIIDKKYSYGNACFTRFYMDYNCFFKPTNRYTNLLKKIWFQKDLIIIEGDRTLLGVGNDLFSCAKTIKRIICPSKDAYFLKDVIKIAVKRHYTNEMILISLGPTATILCCELHREIGCQCIDVGHIDIEYSWQIMKAKSKVPVPGKDWSDTESSNLARDYKCVLDNNISNDENNDYLLSIVEYIR